MSSSVTRRHLKLQVTFKFNTFKLFTFILSRFKLRRADVDESELIYFPLCVRGSEVCSWSAEVSTDAPGLAAGGGAVSWLRAALTQIWSRWVGQLCERRAALGGIYSVYLRIVLLAELQDHFWEHVVKPAPTQSAARSLLSEPAQRRVTELYFMKKKQTNFTG